MRALRGNEEGSTLPLTIFYGFLSLVLILIVVSATSLYLERKRLFTLADGAALAGAEGFSLDSVTRSSGGLEAHLQPADVASAVTGYLGTAASEASAGFDELSVVEAGSPDGRSATVTLAATWHPPVLVILVPDGVRIEVTAVARSVFR
ncbi:MAG: hypothetical protein H7146_01630 [Burkholderiaceae bacterium]|nr:hypothetical protein [Microbacteriaceae bacterium]